MKECTAYYCAFGRTYVPSEGPQPADLLICCEAPGYKEVDLRRPLVGPAGKLFDQFLIAAGLDRSQCRLANRVCCVDLEREDRRPLPAELDACLPRLLKDIEDTAPKVIVAMGNTAIAEFFPGLSISKVRGHFRSWRGVPVVATYHPAYALPMRNPEVGALIIEDLEKARSLCGT